MRCFSRLIVILMAVNVVACGTHSVHPDPDAAGAPDGGEPSFFVDAAVPAPDAGPDPTCLISDPIALGEGTSVVDAAVGDGFALVVRTPTGHRFLRTSFAGQPVSDAPFPAELESAIQTGACPAPRLQIASHDSSWLIAAGDRTAVVHTGGDFTLRAPWEPSSLGGTLTMLGVASNEGGNDGVLVFDGEPATDGAPCGRGPVYVQWVDRWGGDRGAAAEIGRAPFEVGAISALPRGFAVVRPGWDEAEGVRVLLLIGLEGPSERIELQAPIGDEPPQTRDGLAGWTPREIRLDRRAIAWTNERNGPDGRGAAALHAGRLYDGVAVQAELDHALSADGRPPALAFDVVEKDSAATVVWGRGPAVRVRHVTPEGDLGQLHELPTEAPVVAVVAAGFSTGSELGIAWTEQHDDGSTRSVFVAARCSP